MHVSLLSSFYFYKPSYLYYVWNGVAPPLDTLTILITPPSPCGRLAT